MNMKVKMNISINNVKYFLFQMVNASYSYYSSLVAIYKPQIQMHGYIENIENIFCLIFNVNCIFMFNNSIKFYCLTQTDQVFWSKQRGSSHFQLCKSRQFKKKLTQNLEISGHSLLLQNSLIQDQKSSIQHSKMYLILDYCD